MVASNTLVAEARYEWYRRYKTEISEARIRKELGPLGREPGHLVVMALKEYMFRTPAQYFSWPKFRDTWRSFLPEEEGMSAKDVFDKIMKNHTGYAPSIGVYWTEKAIRKGFGDRAADAIMKIGGPIKLENMSVEDRKWIERQFVEAYG